MSDNFEIEIRHYGKTYTIKRPNADVSFDDVYDDVKAILRAAGFEGLVEEIEEMEENEIKRNEEV
jgi:hypothetical protein